MRNRIHLAVLVIIALFCVAIPAARKSWSKGASKPQLVRVIVYQWALATGGSKVDLTDGKLESFVRGVRMSDAEKKTLEKQKGKDDYGVYRISAKLKTKELDSLRKLVGDSGLRDFKPKESDIKEREPMLDECPPTIVLVWTDKRRVFSLPLSGTVRSDISKKRYNCYKAMDDICERLWELNDAYSKASHVSIVAVHGREYQAFEQEREWLVGP